MADDRSTEQTQQLVLGLQNLRSLVQRRQCRMQARIPVLATCFRQQDGSGKDLDPTTMCRECRIHYHVLQALVLSTDQLAAEVGEVLHD